MAVGVAFWPCFLLGAACGLRSLTPPAVVCWGAHLGWLDLAGSHLAFFASPIALVVSTILAIGELIADKTSKVGPRTAPVGLGARIISGALCGAALASPGGLAIGAIVAVVGAIAGTLGGFRIRRALTANGRLPDLAVALVEDIVAVGGGFLVVSRF